jgi:hypothetical protein
MNRRLYIRSGSEFPVRIRAVGESALVPIHDHRENLFQLDVVSVNSH